MEKYIKTEPKKDKLPHWISCGSGSSYEYFDAIAGVRDVAWERYKNGKVVSIQYHIK